MTAISPPAVKRLVPHLPATCPRCYALASPVERVIAQLVLKVILEPSLNGDLSGTRFYFPPGAPLCEQANLAEGTADLCPQKPFVHPR